MHRFVQPSPQSILKHSHYPQKKFCTLYKSVLIFLYLASPRVSQVALVLKNPLASAGDLYKRCKFNPWVRKIPWRRALQSTTVFLPGESHGQMSPASYSPWGCKESGTTQVTALLPTVGNH